MNDCTEPALKALAPRSLIKLAVECLQEVRVKEYEGLKYHEMDAMIVALNYLYLIPTENHTKK